MNTAWLDQLAHRCGIEAEYYAIDGQLKETSSETKRLFLKAMGISANDEATAESSLQAFERRQWQQALPFARITHYSALHIDITLPAATQSVQWQLQLEEKNSLSGTTPFQTLECIAQYELDGGLLQRRRLHFPPNVPYGYHRISITPSKSETWFIVSPGKCWLPADVHRGEKLWGVSAQLYLLRSQHNWGIGDFSDLRNLVEKLTTQGADIVGLNPLHALFLDHPENASPYSPASRLLLNVLNIDVTAITEFDQCVRAQAIVNSTEFKKQLHVSQNAKQVQYATVTKLKLQTLRELFAYFQAQKNSQRSLAFQEFRQKNGFGFEQSCVFKALREYFASQNPSTPDWHQWPIEYQNPHSAAVKKFAEEHKEAVTFSAWLQWIADTQLGDAASKTNEMAIGLYRDLAVGADSAGAETWINQKAITSGVHVGAPPDYFTPLGQDWGLPPFNPHALQAEAYQSFIELVRANMRHAGGLRIDHVMALQHLYWIPAGQPASNGAYVTYPMEDLINILALESHRHNCLVIGEDLGTVPEGFRERMAEANILSYRVLFFEHDGTHYIPADKYIQHALAVANGHDLPTLRGWWSGNDIDLLEKLNLCDAENLAEKRYLRSQDRHTLWKTIFPNQPFADEMPINEITLAVHTFLARSNSILAIAQIDDITGEIDPVNLPGTFNEHPNWRRRLSLDLDSAEFLNRLNATCAAFRKERS